MKLLQGVAQKIFKDKRIVDIIINLFYINPMQKYLVY